MYIYNCRMYVCMYVCSKPLTPTYWSRYLDPRLIYSDSHNDYKEDEALDIPIYRLKRLLTQSSRCIKKGKERGRERRTENKV